MFTIIGEDELHNLFHAIKHGVLLCFPNYNSFALINGLHDCIKLLFPNGCEKNINLVPTS